MTEEEKDDVAVRAVVTAILLGPFLAKTNPDTTAHRSPDKLFKNIGQLVEFAGAIADVVILRATQPDVYSNILGKLDG